MQTLKAPIFNPVYRNVDGIELNDDQALLIDGYLSERGGTVKRPGVAEFMPLAARANSVDGIFWWEEKEMLLAVAAGRLYRVTRPASAYILADLGVAIHHPAVPPPILIHKKVSFCSDSSRVYFANESNIVTYDGATAVDIMSAAHAPTTVRSVAYLDEYIIANRIGSPFWYWSDIGAGTTWSALSFASGTGAPDNVDALTVFNREIYLFGARSVEIWENDGSTPFVRVPGGYYEIGCIAPNSVVKTENGIYWLDDKRRMRFFDGKNLHRISSPYDKEIQTYPTVVDCQGDYAEIDGVPLLVFNFLLAGKTLVYNLTSESWSEWAEWDSVTNSYGAWRGNSILFVGKWGKHIVGNRDYATLHEASINHHDDNGQVIRMSRRTGHIDYGTSKQKRSNELRIRVKRGHGAAGTSPKLMVRWRDNNRPEWSNEHWIDLGESGETDIIRRMFRTGIFRTRQYEFACSSDVPLVFTDAEEDIDILGH